MRSKRSKDLFLFLGIAFAIPLVSIFFQRIANSPAIKLVLYGIEAAAPSIAAIVVAAKNRNCKAFVAENCKVRNPITAFVIPAAAALVPMLFAKVTVCVWLESRFALRGISTTQAITISWAFIAEEFGWRGYLYPLLCRQMKRKILAPLLTGAVWAIWHYHYFLFDGMQVPVVWFFIGCVAESYIYGCLLDWSGHNLFSAMTYHFSWNLFIHVLTINPADNMGNPLPYIILTVLEAIVCLPLFFSGRAARGIRL